MTGHQTHIPVSEPALTTFGDAVDFWRLRSQTWEISMQIRIGFEFVYEFVARTPMVLMLNVHPSRIADLLEPDQLRTSPALPVTRYQDAFGNTCTRLVAPAGQLQIATDALVADSGLPDAVEP